MTDCLKIKIIKTSLALRKVNTKAMIHLLKGLCENFLKKTLPKCQVEII